MCGIVGYVGSQQAVPVLVEGSPASSTAGTTRPGWRCSGRPA